MLMLVIYFYSLEYWNSLKHKDLQVFRGVELEDLSDDDLRHMKIW